MEKLKPGPGGFQWGKHKENIIRRLPWELTKHRCFLWRGHDAFYFRGFGFEVRIMKPWLQ